MENNFVDKTEGWVGGKILPWDITDPINVQKLRELTTELEMKIERALRSLFTSSVMPWEQWFINAIANPDNRAALGIPNNLEKVDISHLLGGREGFHETFRRTNLERLGIIIAESLRTIVSNPLAGAGLTPFKATIETLSNELLRELRWNEFDNKLKAIVTESSPSWNEIEQLTYGFWHSYKDPAMNVVLDTLTRARYSDKLLTKRQLNTVIEILVDSYKKTNGVNSCVTLLWLLSVIAFSSDTADANIADVLNGIHLPSETGECTGAHLSGEDPYLYNKKDMVDSLGVLQEFKDKKYIQRVISIPAAIEVYAYIKEKKLDKLDEFMGNLEALLKHVLLLNNEDHDGKKPLIESDWGHLYFMCNKLDALYSFWIWYHADLLTHEKHTLHKIGKYWYSDIVFGKVKKIIQEKDCFVNKCIFEESVELAIDKLDKNNERDKIEIKIRTDKLKADYKDSVCEDVWKGRKRIKGIEQSVFLLGGAGFGKTELLKQIYSPKHDAPIPNKTTSSETNQDKKISEQSIPAKMVQLTPLSFVKTCNLSDTLKEHASKLAYHHKCVVFIDELHIETQPSVYALLLVPLGEGVKNARSDAKQIILDCGLEKPYSKCEWMDNNELNIHFVFASSRYQTKREFLEEAFITKNTAMRDFATRVHYWIELPGFSLVPEQKLALLGNGTTVKSTSNDVSNAQPPYLLTSALDQDVVRKYLDLSISSTREFVTTKPTDVDNRLWGLNNVVRQNSYPKWLWESMKIEYHE